MCSKNTPERLDFVGPSWYTSYKRSIEQLFARTRTLAPAGGGEGGAYT